MRLDQENRESRGSVSYTDYYSNEDGQIRKITQMPQTVQQISGGNAQSKVAYIDDLPIDNVEEDEDHTLTLRQSEEQKKQDIKLIFEQKDNLNPAKGSCKKIGR